MNERKQFTEMFVMSEKLVELFGNYPYLHSAFNISFLTSDKKLIWKLINPIKLDYKPYRIFFGGAEVVYSENLLYVYTPYLSLKEFIEDIYEVSIHEKMDWRDPQNVSNLKERYSDAFKEIDMMEKIGKSIGEKRGVMVEKIIEPDGTAYIRVVQKILKKENVIEIAEMILESIDILRQIYMVHFEIDEKELRISKDERLLEEMRSLLYNVKNFSNKLLDKGYQIEHIILRNWPLEMTGLMEISAISDIIGFISVDLNRKDINLYHLQLYLESTSDKLEILKDKIKFFFDRIETSDERELICYKDSKTLLDLIELIYKLIDRL
jgi:hypothetical protein